LHIKDEQLGLGLGLEWHTEDEDLSSTSCIYTS